MTVKTYDFPAGWRWSLETFEPARRGIPVRFCANFVLRNADGKEVEHARLDEESHVDRERKLAEIMEQWSKDYGARRGHL